MNLGQGGPVEYERRQVLLKLIEAAEGLVLHAANQAALFDSDLENDCDEIADALSRVRHG